MQDTIIGILLMIISILFLIRICKGKSCDYKSRIRVYCAILEDEIWYVDTKRKKVIDFIEEICKEYEVKKKEFKIVIKYMSKLKYSLMRES